MTSFSHLVRADLHEFVAYSSARQEASHGKIWLNANESPWSWQGSVTSCEFNRYPQSVTRELLQQIADLFSVTPQQLVLTHGSDEAIDLLIRLFCRAYHDSIIVCPPTFDMYSVSAHLQAAKEISIPLVREKKFQLDKDSILKQINTNDTNSIIKLVFLCSPNNPTGNLISKEKVTVLCTESHGRCIIVVDEAYIDYANAVTLAELLPSHDNLVILRTFSKAFGLAAIRCGALLAHPDLVAWIKKILTPYPLSGLSIAALSQGLSQERLLQIKLQINCIQTERQRVSAFLKSVPIVKKVWPSEANFILAEVEDAETFMQITADQGIILRNMSKKQSLNHCVRISIGLPEENDLLMSVIQKMSM